MLNNFYKDTNEDVIEKEGELEKHSEKHALGEYCAFGYFDALQLFPAHNYELQGEHCIWESLNSLAMEHLKGENSRRVLSCLTERKDLDNKFWDNAERKPFLFTSLIRIRESAISHVKAIMDRVNNVKTKNYDVCCITYLTNDHSEIVLFFITDSFEEGMGFLADLSNEKDFLKKYTIFAAREEALNENSELYQSIAEEQVNCRMKAVIKNWDNLDSFLNDLSKEIKIPRKMIRYYRVLGSKDLAIEIDNVEIRKILRLYKMGELLTHTNKKYGNTFYNIESQFLVRERNQDDTELDRGTNGRN